MFSKNFAVLKQLIVFACGLLLSSSSTRAQQPGSGAHLPEVELRAERVVRFQLLGLQTATVGMQVPQPIAMQALQPAAAGTYNSASVVIGPRQGDFIAKVTGWSLSTEYPAQVFCQPRQNRDQNLDFGWSDQFVVQVIETSRDFVRIRIRRIDDGTGSSGWGQNLRVDILVIE
jgi:hypothetical protein